MIIRTFNALAAFGLAASCSVFDPLEPRVETAATYTDPDQSGLVSVRPYPMNNSVCRVIGENAVTAEYLDDRALLIACPAHEFGATMDRIEAGAARLEHVGAWVLLSEPQ